MTQTNHPANLSTRLLAARAELGAIRFSPRLSSDAASEYESALDAIERAAGAVESSDFASAFRFLDAAVTTLRAFVDVADIEDALDDVEDAAHEATCQYCDRPSADGEDRACEQCADDVRRGDANIARIEAWS